MRKKKRRETKDCQAGQSNRDTRAGGRRLCEALVHAVDTLARVFLFSSRRRHTRCLSDWSSDVCSSDLNVGCTPTKTMVASGRVAYLARRGPDYGVSTGSVKVDMRREIGRASCRERV